MSRCITITFTGIGTRVSMRKLEHVHHVVFSYRRIHHRRRRGSPWPPGQIFSRRNQGSPLHQGCPRSRIRRDEEQRPQASCWPGGPARQREMEEEKGRAAPEWTVWQQGTPVKSRHWSGSAANKSLCQRRGRLHCSWFRPRGNVAGRRGVSGCVVRGARRDLRQQLRDVSRVRW